MGILDRIQAINESTAKEKALTRELMIKGQYCKRQVSDIAGQIKQPAVFVPKEEKIASDDYGLCPGCKRSKLKLKTGKFGKFLGCSAYPVCTYARNLMADRGMVRYVKPGEFKARAAYLRPQH